MNIASPWPLPERVGRCGGCGGHRGPAHTRRDGGRGQDEGAPWRTRTLYRLLNTIYGQHMKIVKSKNEITLGWAVSGSNLKKTLDPDRSSQCSPPLNQT